MTSRHRLAIAAIGALALFLAWPETTSTAFIEARVPADAPPAAVKAKPGYAVGRLTEVGGKPIAVAGAKLSVKLAGVSSKSGEKVYYNSKVQPDGSYEQKLVDGSYSYGGASLEVLFDGKNFTFPLEPVGDDKSSRESEKGLVQDFVWKRAGLRPGLEADAADYSRWYGASVDMTFKFYRDDIEKTVPAGPAGTKCVFTLTPKGKLIDGSKGKPLSFTREYEPDLKRPALQKATLVDIPLAVYTVTGVEVAPDGKKKPLLMQLEYKKFGPSLEVHFEPSRAGGFLRKFVFFTRETD